jgi:hypothetical protein
VALISMLPPFMLVNIAGFDLIPDWEFIVALG